jgi:diadenosine tetraphosphatase ApaH/serine/threonine PP2A family protein phosphatase
LFGYYSVDQLVEQMETVSSDVLLVGHTHLPTICRVGRKLIINPGSVGQPKDEDPGASYAIWEDGRAEIRRIDYPVEETCRGLSRMDLSPDVADLLETWLRNGAKVPSSHEASVR